MDDRTPVLVGSAQLLQRDAEPKSALEPLEMLEQVARGAAADASCRDAVLAELDTIALINTVGWSPQNPAGLVAERLAAKPRAMYTSEMGGQIGVTLANLVCERITRGESRIGLVLGCNNMRTLMRARKAGVELEWTQGGSGKPELVGELRRGNSKLESEYGLRSPTDIYPIFENALRARRELDLDTHRQRMGELFSRFTEVAARNPYAWFPTYRSAEELTTVTPQNRMIAFPYPKYLNAVLQTDQAAGLLILSAEAARAYGIPAERRVYWLGGAQSEEEAWWVSERPDFAACPALRDSTCGALRSAGLEIDDIDLIDFYSCFPSAVSMACEMLDLPEDDPRGFTVTGGLPYAGGPASAYTLHALASMAARLRENPGSKGLVTGNGWYLTKHAASVWSTVPKGGDAATGAMPTPDSSGRLERAPLAVVEEARGKGRLEAYTVVYDRDGAPARGIVLGRQEDGRRFLANTPPDRDLLEAFVACEQVGRDGELSHHEGANRFDPA